MIVHFGWMKGHAGIDGNELVDRLAKETAVEDGPVVYDKIPKEVIVTREKTMDYKFGSNSGWRRGSGQLHKLFSHQRKRG